MEIRLHFHCKKSSPQHCGQLFLYSRICSYRDIENNYLGYTSGTVTGVVGEGTAEQLLTESYIYYNVDIQTTDKRVFKQLSMTSIRN